MPKINSRNASAIAAEVSAGRPFDTHGALSGIRGSYPGFTGQLPSEFHADACAATYTVYSYRTPIAWQSPDGAWHVPTVRYSVTTSRHQGMMRGVIARLT